MTLESADQKKHSVAELTERVNELEALLHTIERGKVMWQGTFDVIADPVLVIDKEFRVTRANRALASAAKRDIRDVISNKCYEIFAGSTKPCSHCPVAQIPAEGQMSSSELDPFPSGRRYAARGYALPENSGGGLVLYYRDVTDERDLQRRLMAAEKMAAIGSLAGGVAHEINNPLGAILAFTQLARQELAEDHSCQNDLAEIENATLRCKKIVRDLLDYSRQGFSAEMSAVDLNDAIESTLALLTPAARDAQVVIRTTLAAGLSPLLGHRDRIQQVVMNFAANAIDAMRAKGGVLAVVTRQEDGHLVLDVSDTGTGISPEVLARIFDPYFTTKGPGEGTGLGLSIVDKIVREHRGTISVESVLGQGTRFVARFPMVGAKGEV